ncbi:MAG: hypothetical protein LQ340_000389 [Diploschistes diacapsis]|nr:MAG: hypothetical protein LQ340_000389 [Diploschistes diacapsis]
MAETASIAHLRAQFPGLEQGQVFMDNAGGSQTLGSVITAIQNYLSKTNVQLGASYSISQKSTGLYEKGYQAAAKYINASRDDIVLGGSTTQLFRNLSYALSFPAGSEIILSKLDHEANLSSWVSLAECQQLTIKWWAPESSSSDPDNSNPKLTPENLAPLISDKTVFAACTHTSNVLGTIHDVKALARTLHEKAPSAFLCVDAVAYAPHRPIDVRDLDVDFYAFSWYKVYGPHISQLYAHPRTHSHIKPLGHYFNPSRTVEQKLALAASSYELVAAVPAVVDYCGGTDPSSRTGFWKRAKEHEHRLQRLLLECLNANENIRVLGERSADPELRVPTISFVVKGKSPKALVEQVDRASGDAKGPLDGGQDGDQGLGESRQFGIRWGHFYSKRLCEEVLGLEKDGEGVVRVSLVHYNTGKGRLTTMILQKRKWEG